jgi:hypothetical protein
LNAVEQAARVSSFQLAEEVFTEGFKRGTDGLAFYLRDIRVSVSSVSVNFGIPG